MDPVVRRVVQEALGNEDPKKRFADAARLPLMPNTQGLEIPIKSVRIETTDSVTAVGRNHRKRHVKTGANHHLCVYINDKTQKGRYEVISLLEPINGLELVSHGCNPIQTPVSDSCIR